MQTQPPLPCSSQDAGQAMQTQPPLPCSSQDAGQAMQTQPPLPCSSQDAGQAMETQPPLSCAPCLFQDAGQAMQIQPPLSGAPCSSRKDMQTITSIQHSPQEPDQQNLPCTPCFSGKGQPMQTKPSLMSTPCSSHATTLQPKQLQASKPSSSVAKTMLTVLPRHMHGKVLTFDHLRYKAKTCKKTPHKLLQQYQAASATVKDKLIEQLGTNLQEIKTSKSPVHQKQLQHNTNVIKRILGHEWNINIEH